MFYVIQFLFQSCSKTFSSEMPLHTTKYIYVIILIILFIAPQLSSHLLCKTTKSSWYIFRPRRDYVPFLRGAPLWTSRRACEPGIRGVQMLHAQSTSSLSEQFISTGRRRGFPSPKNSRCYNPKSQTRLYALICKSEVEIST